MALEMMERFFEAGFGPVEVDGELVHPMYRLHLDEGDVVRVTWLGAKSPRVQGLALRLRLPDKTGRRGEGGLLGIGSSQSPSYALWMDTAPPVVDATCVRLKDGAELQISNRWRLPDGREDEWFHNFGMRIEPAGEDEVVLHCSDGYGERLTFDDLTVRIERIRAARAGSSASSPPSSSGRD